MLVPDYVSPNSVPVGTRVNDTGIVTFLFYWDLGNVVQTVGKAQQMKLALLEEILDLLYFNYILGKY